MEGGNLNESICTCSDIVEGHIFPPPAGELINPLLEYPV